jgi:hypothetical protein
MNKDDAANISKSRKFNIVFLIDGLGWGGAERLMVPILANIDRELFSVRVGVFQIRNGNPIADDLRSLGIPVDLIPVPYLRDLTAVSRIASYLKDVKADLIHAQLELGDILGGIAALRMHLPQRFNSSYHALSRYESKIQIASGSGIFLSQAFF